MACPNSHHGSQPHKSLSPPTTPPWKSVKFNEIENDNLQHFNPSATTPPIAFRDVLIQQSLQVEFSLSTSHTATASTTPRPPCRFLILAPQ